MENMSYQAKYVPHSRRNGRRLAFTCTLLSRPILVQILPSSYEFDVLNSWLRSFKSPLPLSVFKPCVPSGASSASLTLFLPIPSSVVPSLLSVIDPQF
jgi:hypothetical protein